ncbi:extensin family protein [Methylocystis sp. B8]|uniref:extensin-like domain-containing protein n=1 Tax=Methylocystis sp. B8 TaxID=544938 RepID=UPI0010FEE9A5|nr:extensin family protein [Methylocystis sp. B8]TLG78931.1 extensin family protein [Methylocystis sp. B8]
MDFRGIILRRRTIAFALLMGVGATDVVAFDVPTPPHRPTSSKNESAPEAKPPANGQPQAETAPGEDCTAKLRGAGVDFETTQTPPGDLDGCAIDGPVRLAAVMVDKRRVALNAKPVLSCAFALQFSDFVKNLLAPLGFGAMGASLVAIETGSGYECRGRNHDSEAKLSAHAKGLALDVGAFVFSDGRKIGIDSQPDPQSTVYVKALRTAACGWFTTVLGPGSDPFHATHLHFDIERHGSNDAYRICQ